MNQWSNAGLKEFYEWDFFSFLDKFLLNQRPRTLSIYILSTYVSINYIARLIRRNSSYKNINNGQKIEYIGILLLQYLRIDNPFVRLSDIKINEVIYKILNA